MKRMIVKIIALVLAMMIMSSVSLAEVVLDVYTDTPANPTQDNVKDIQAVMTQVGADPMAYTFLTMEPTKATISLIGQLVDFVKINQNPPVRWFPEETQRDIEKLLDGADPDALYIPEVFSMLPQRCDSMGDVAVDMLMDIDYAPGALIIVVLGRETESGIEWHALKGDVLVDDTIHFEIPAEVEKTLAGYETLTVVFAVKPSDGWTEEEHEIQPQPTFVPSKSGSNMTYVEEQVVISGVGDPQDCKILIVTKPDEAEQELDRFSEWMGKSGNTPVSYFSEQVRSEIQLLLAGTDINTLLPYEVECVMVENYQEPFGDVMAKFIFPTAFQADKGTVTLLGMPQDDGTFTWTVLHTKMDTPYMEITFSSTVLPDMMSKAGLMIVFSETIAE